MKIHVLLNFLAMSVALVGSAYAQSAEGTATRAVPANYQPGNPVAISITITPGPNAFSSAVEEKPPEGWTVSGISEGGNFDAVNGKVKWVFLDGETRTLTYQVTPPPGETGTKRFNGLASFDGSDYPIVGDTEISLLKPDNKNP
jgi:hypothetical protein